MVTGKRNRRASNPREEEQESESDEQGARFCELFAAPADVPANVETKSSPVTFIMRLWLINRGLFLLLVTTYNRCKTGVKLAVPRGERCRVGKADVVASFASSKPFFFFIVCLHEM